MATQHLLAQRIHTAAVIDHLVCQGQPLFAPGLNAHDRKDRIAGNPPPLAGPGKLKSRFAINNQDPVKSARRSCFDQERDTDNAVRHAQAAQ